MSSKIDPFHHNRKDRWLTKKLSDLPKKIQDLIASIHQTCWSVWLYWSYANGTYTTDSDIDIAVKNVWVYRKIINNISEYHKIKIDAVELKSHLIILE